MDSEQPPHRIVASIIVPVKDDKRLERLLQSLQRQTTSRDQFEVIVVENGSGGCEEWARSYGARYFCLKQANTYAARNVGIGAARGKYVLATDSDCVAAPNWVGAYVSCFEARPDVSAFGGPIDRYEPRTSVQRYGSNLVNGQRSLNYLPILRFPYVVTANCAYRKDAILAVGGYDEELLSGGDVDACYKLGIQGHQIALCARGVVFHDNRPTVKSHFLRFFQYACYQALLFKKYRASPGRRFILNPYPYQCFGKAFRGAVRAILRPSGQSRDVIWSSYLIAVEGLGVLIGDAFGACKYRVPYL